MLNPFHPGRVVLGGLHAGAVLATHVMAGAVLGVLAVVAAAGVARMAKDADR